jgi:ABC-type multidrug transport system fused ATPase/permease subunit
MRFVWVGALLLLIASVASLISNRQSGRLIDESWATASHVLPESELGQLQRATPIYTAGFFARLPEPLREKFASKMWQASELIIFRSLMLWQVIPVFVIAVLAGLLEGRWARANQKALVKMHSPMRFSLALTSLALTPVLALLWITAPVAVPPTLLVFALGAVAVISTRNLVVHAPTQF